MKKNRGRDYSVIDAIRDTLLGTAEYVPEKEYSRRLGICHACEFFRPRRFGTCAKCGCVMAIKARYRDAECPLQKWLSYKE